MKLAVNDWANEVMTNLHVDNLIIKLITNEFNDKFAYL